jgi:hypothetical protein
MLHLSDVGTAERASLVAVVPGDYAQQLLPGLPPQLGAFTEATGEAGSDPPEQEQQVRLIQRQCLELLVQAVAALADERNPAFEFTLLCLPAEAEYWGGMDSQEAGDLQSVDSVYLLRQMMATPA